MASTYFQEADFHTQWEQRKYQIICPSIQRGGWKVRRVESWATWGMHLEHRLPRCLPIAAQRVVYIIFSPLVITIVLKCAELLACFQWRVKSMMPSANTTERNSLEFVLLINEENNDLYIPAWTGMCSLLVATWREGRSLDVSLCDWGKRGCIEDSGSPSGPLPAWRSLCSGRQWLRKHLTGLGATCTYHSLVSWETAVFSNLQGSFWESESRGARHLTCIIFPS